MKNLFMFFRIIQCCAVGWLCASCGSLVVYRGDQAKLQVFGDDDYVAHIGIVQVYPATDVSMNQDAVVRIGQSIAISFDLLRAEYDFLSVEIIHCNEDWTQSRLTRLDYLDNSHDFQIDDFAYSFNTLVPYISYRYRTPKIKRSGNYVLRVWDNSPNRQVLFDRRFMVYEDLVSITPQILYSQAVKNRQTHHQIIWSIHYENLDLFNPFSDLKVVLLQNHNLNESIHGLQPTLTRADQKSLQYRSYNGENEFHAKNEFRFADVRATQYRGLNVKDVIPDRSGFKLILNPDKPRKGLAYSGLNEDKNGGFYLANANRGEGIEQADYVSVTFTLSSPKYPEEIYVSGKFNNWRLENPMLYDAARGHYSTTALLKQGHYDYQYLSDSGDPQIVEGDFIEAENNYEILVYYQDPSKGYDALVGYSRFSSRD